MKKTNEEEELFHCVRVHERKVKEVESKEPCVLSSQNISPSLNSFFAAAAATLRFLATSIPFRLDVFECAVHWVCVYAWKLHGNACATDKLSFWKTIQAEIWKDLNWVIFLD